MSKQIKKKKIHSHDEFLSLQRECTHLSNIVGCEEWLEENEKRINEAIVNAGWNYITSNL